MENPRLSFITPTVIAGDRQATEGHLVAHRFIQKVFASDRYSAVAIAGTAGLAMEMVRLGTAIGETEGGPSGVDHLGCFEAVVEAAYLHDLMRGFTRGGSDLRLRLARRRFIAGGEQKEEREGGQGGAARLNVHE